MTITSTPHASSSGPPSTPPTGRATATVTAPREGTSRRRAAPSRVVGAALLLALGACYGGRGGGVDGRETGPDSGAGAGEDGVDDEPSELDGDGMAPPRGIRRLSVREYNRTVEVVLGDDTQPANKWAPDTTTTGFDTDAKNAWVNGQLARQIRASAEEVAERFASRWSEFVDCDLSDEGDLACGTALIEDIGRRLFRRPLDEPELAGFVELFEFGRDGGSFEDGVALCVQAMLQSPSFLFLSQSGRDDDPTRLNDFELASRLSYFLTGGPPDDELLDAAEDDALHGALREQAARLLDSPEGRKTLVDLHLKWLHMGNIAERDPDRFPKFTAEVREDLVEAFSRMIESHIFDPNLPGTFASMLTDPIGTVTENTAYLFDVPPGDEEFSVVELDPARRAGLLTDPALMASLSEWGASRPVYRGVVLLENIMCQPLGEAPANAGAVKDEYDEEGLTTREFYELVTSRAECKACHEVINGAGFVFEHYDADGSWRDTEIDKPIDASGSLWIPTEPELNGPVDDAVDAVNALGTSKTAAECYSRQYFRYLLGRAESGSDDEQAMIDRWVEALMSEDHGAIHAFILELVTSEVFTTRETNPSDSCE